MTTFGFIELIALLTTLGSFGVDANPRAPAAAATTGGKVITIEGEKACVTPDGSLMLAVKQGQLLLGSSARWRSRTTA